MNDRLKKTFSASLLIVILSFVFVFVAIASGTFIGTALVFFCSTGIVFVIAWTIVLLCN